MTMPPFVLLIWFSSAPVASCAQFRVTAMSMRCASPATIPVMAITHSAKHRILQNYRASNIGCADDWRDHSRLILSGLPHQARRTRTATAPAGPNKASREAENVRHRIVPRRTALAPQRRGHRAVRVDGAVLPHMADANAFTVQGEDHVVIAHHRAAAKGGKTDGAGLTRTGVSLAGVKRHIVQTHAAALGGGLALWRDGNSNHQTDAGELISLGAQGITSLDTAFVETPVYQNGNVLIEHGSATKADGSKVDLVDAYFQVADTTALGNQEAAFS